MLCAVSPTLHICNAIISNARSSSFAVKCGILHVVRLQASHILNKSNEHQAKSSRIHVSVHFKLSDWRFWACAINVKSSVSSETAKYFWYKCHGLFINSPVMTTMKSYLKRCSKH